MLPPIMLQVEGLFNFMPLHGSTAPPEQQGLWILSKDVKAAQDVAENTIGPTALNACKFVAAGYVMFKIYKAVCKLKDGDPASAGAGAKPCRMSQLPAPMSFVKGADSITSLSSNKNHAVKNAVDRSEVKSKTYRMVSVYVQACL